MSTVTGLWGRGYWKLIRRLYCMIYRPIINLSCLTNDEEQDKDTCIWWCGLWIQWSEINHRSGETLFPIFNYCLIILNQERIVHFSKCMCSYNYQLRHHVENIHLCFKHHVTARCCLLLTVEQMLFFNDRLTFTSLPGELHDGVVGGLVWSDDPESYAFWAISSW